MPQPLDDQLFTGAHPTCREFTTRLTDWGFAERKQDGVHTVFRGPHGGTLRVLRSQLGRIDPALAAKAAKLVGVTPSQFWAGPEATLIPPQDFHPSQATPVQRRSAKRDTVVSIVLAIHVEADRPLGFGQVVELAENRITREQVKAASSALCRDGQLDRIRSGVYQWSAGRRSTPASISRPDADRTPETRSGPVQPVSAGSLFAQLFPEGIQMTGELLDELEQWARLTDKLASQSRTAS